MLNDRNWDSVRTPEHHIDLAAAYRLQFGRKPTGRAARFIRDTENTMPIMSRQAAAIAINTAHSLHTLEMVVGQYVS